MCATHLPVSSTAIIYNRLSGRVAHVIDTERGVLATGWGGAASGQANKWLPGGFFMQQRIELTFLGMELRSLELIRYDPETQTFPSFVYSNMSPVPLPYKWEVQGDRLTISVNYGPIDATFKGKFSKDGNRFSGGWRPNPGADETINVPYDIGGTRVK
jgi:hypothetical protein